MIVLDSILEANQTADIRSFRFANLSEFNKFIESFQFEDYPCHVMEPFELRQEWMNNRIHQIAPIRGWVVKRIDQDTTNFKTASIESDHIQPMRALAKKLIRAMVESDVTDPEIESARSVIRPEYGLFSAKVFGVSYTLDWPIADKFC